MVIKTRTLIARKHVAKDQPALTIHTIPIPIRQPVRGEMGGFRMEGDKLGEHK